jgi:hypothetical protein
VGAAIEQRADFSLRVPQQDDRAQPQPHGDVVVVLRDLALVPEIDPYRAEDIGHLGLEDRRVGIDQPVDAIFLDEFVPVVKIGRAFDPRRVELLQHWFSPSRLRATVPAPSLVSAIA